MNYHPENYQQTIKLVEKNLYELLKGKLLTIFQVNLNFMVNRNTFELIPYHPAMFENIGASAVKEADLSLVVQISYSASLGLYVACKTLQSQEGTTQGDPLAMDMYGVATLPLLRFLQNTRVSQRWYADGVSAVGRLEDLILFFKQLTENGAYFGYRVNAPKCQSILSESSNIKALRLFEWKTAEIVEGCRVLGSVIGIEKAFDNFNVTTVGKYSNLLKKTGACSETIPSERLRMPHKRRGTKIKIGVPNNAEYILLRKKDLMESLHTDQRHVKNHKKTAREKEPLNSLAALPLRRYDLMLTQSEF